MTARWKSLRAAADAAASRASHRPGASDASGGRGTADGAQAGVRRPPLSPPRSLHPRRPSRAFDQRQSRYTIKHFPALAGCVTGRGSCKWTLCSCYDKHYVFGTYSQSSMMAHPYGAN